jgi:hypothetical protein
VLAAIDAINWEFGRDTVHLAVSGTQQRWAMRAGNRLPHYTTRWDELPLVCQEKQPVSTGTDACLIFVHHPPTQ